MRYDSILDTIGRTPVVRLHRIAPKHVTLYAKVESFNPGGPVKDRLAIARNNELQALLDYQLAAVAFEAVQQAATR